MNEVEYRPAISLVPTPDLFHKADGAGDYQVLVGSWSAEIELKGKFAYVSAPGGLATPWCVFEKISLTDSALGQAAELPDLRQHGDALGCTAARRVGREGQ